VGNQGAATVSTGPGDGADDFEDRTMIIRPNPGGRAARPAPVGDEDHTQIYQPAKAAPGPGSGDPAPRVSGDGASEALFEGLKHAVPTGSTEVSKAAARLLMLAGRLANLAQFDQVPRLKEFLVSELSDFERQCAIAGTDRKLIRQCHYILCALLDDIVLSRPWGASSGWSQRSLVAVHHNEVVSGDRVFELAEQFDKVPPKDPETVELVYLAFALGFEGKLRIDPRGPAQLSQMRERVFRHYRQMFPAPERDLSSLWQGVTTAHKPLRELIPLWMYWVGFALAALALFALLLFLLSGRADRSYRALADVFNRPAPRFAAPAEVAEVEVADDPLPKIMALMQPDIDARRAEVVNEGVSVKVRLLNNGLFASASADVSGDYQQTLDHLAAALKIAGGEVQVLGHTDDLAIRTLRFPSNMELSVARGEAIKAGLVARGIVADQVRVEGRVDTDPLVPNDGPDGRNANRRIDVVISKVSEWK
jgi:type VI secretion system protein ImpK